MSFKYSQKLLSFSKFRVGRLNPSWLEENPDHDGNFEKAVALTGAEFVDVFNGYVKNWLPAREIVEVAMKGS